jgi:hypothetical protein
MKRTFIVALSAIVGAPLLGCFPIDRAADRTLTIYQTQSAETYDGQFQIDASRLPPDAIEARRDRGGTWDATTRLTLNSKYQIKVVLLPATQPDEASGAEPEKP